VDDRRAMDSIAVALVISPKWQPLRAVAGALLFGGAISLNLQMQAVGVPISPFLLDMLRSPRAWPCWPSGAARVGMPRPAASDECFSEATN